MTDTKNKGILDRIRESGFCLDRLAEYYPELGILKGVKQNPEYHAEGDVYVHTGMVCGELLKLPEWDGLPKREQEMLFLAAAFHDIGKPACTKFEDGRWTSPKHTVVGEKVFRAMAYRGADRFGMDFWERELAAKLVRFHGLGLYSPNARGTGRPWGSVCGLRKGTGGMGKCLSLCECLYPVSVLPQGRTAAGRPAL